jgi:hypothetical protein
MPGGGFDAGFDVGFDIGTDDAARLPTWFRGAPLHGMRPANVFCEARPVNAGGGLRMANLQQPVTGWIPGGGGLPMLPYGGEILLEDGDNIQLESSSGELLLG